MESEFLLPQHKPRDFLRRALAPLAKQMMSIEIEAKEPKQKKIALCGFCLFVIIGLCGTVFLFAVLFNPEIECKVSIVGAGWSGLYVGYRLVVENTNFVDPHNLCIFEATDRIGGRAFSISYNNLRLELGSQNYLDSQILIKQLVNDLFARKKQAVTQTQTRQLVQLITDSHLRYTHYSTYYA